MKKRKLQRGRLAFTLVEMLSAMAILALMLTSVFKLMGHTLMATRLSHQQMEASQQGRSVLDSLNADLCSLVAQDGLGILLRENNGSVELAFLTRSRGPKGTATRFLAVAYLLDGNNLVRQTAPIDWNALVLPDTALTAVNAPVSTSVLATGILRFGTTITLNDGNVVTIDQLPDSAKAAGSSPFVQLLPSEGQVQSAYPKVESLTVATAMLSEQNLKLAGDMATKLGKLEEGKTALAVWSANSTASKLQGVPPPVIAGLQLAQQTFEIK